MKLIFRSFQKKNETSENAVFQVVSLKSGGTVRIAVRTLVVPYIH
jgi:hypothetical protein